MPSVTSALVALVFAATGATQVLGFLRSARLPASLGDRADRVDRLGHAVMSVEMAAMVATGSTADRWGIQAAVLAIVTGWFAVRAVGGRPGLFSHALTAAAMTGMLALPPQTAPQSGGRATGVAMSSMPMPQGPISGSHLGTLIGGCLLISAAGSVAAAYRASRKVRSGTVAAALSHAAMAVGMAAMLLPLR